MGTAIEKNNRVRKLREYEEAVPDMQDEFKNTVKLIAYRFKSSYTGIQFMDDEKHLVKASHGTEFGNLAREDSVCVYTIQKNEPLHISDLSKDPRTSDKSIVSNPPNMRSYLGVPLTSPEGYTVGTVCVMDVNQRSFDSEETQYLQWAADEIINKFEMYNENHKLRSMTEEREALLREIHHRLKNNLALISGLVELENMRYNSEEVKRMLENIQLRIKSVATMHQRLHESESLEAVELKPYLWELMNNHHSNLTDPEKQITCDIEGEDIQIPEKKTIYVGLLVNELLTNIYKHAFKGKKQGSISIRTRRRSDECQIIIEDDGVGLPDDFDLNGRNSLGSKLITTFTDQLNGNLEFYNKGGACFRIQFPC